MTAVRPDLPLTPSSPALATAAARSAQAAFFRAALDRAQAPAGTPATSSTGQAEPRREQRPGALLDIRV